MKLVPAKGEEKLSQYCEEDVSSQICDQLCQNVVIICSQSQLNGFFVQAMQVEFYGVESTVTAQ